MSAAPPAQFQNSRPSSIATVVSKAMALPGVMAAAVAQVSLEPPGGGVSSVMLSVPKPVLPANPATRMRNWSPTETPLTVTWLCRPQLSSLHWISLRAAQLPL